MQRAGYIHSAQSNHESLHGTPTQQSYFHIAKFSMDLSYRWACTLLRRTQGSIVHCRRKKQTDGITRDCRATYEIWIPSRENRTHSNTAARSNNIFYPTPIPETHFQHGYSGKGNLKNLFVQMPMAHRTNEVNSKCVSVFRGRVLSRNAFCFQILRWPRRLLSQCCRRSRARRQ